MKKILILLLTLPMYCAGQTQLDSILQTTKNPKIKSFFENYWNAAKNIQDQYNIPGGLLLAQMAFESDWCESFYARQRKNVLGIKLEGSFCWFRSVEDCLDVYRRILNQRCYKQVEPKGFNEWLHSLETCNWAGNEPYISYIAPIIHKYNLRWI